MKMFDLATLICVSFASVVTLVVFAPEYGNGFGWTVRYHLKKMAMRVLLKLNERRREPYVITDKLQVFSEHDELPVDAVYFSTSSEEGQILLFATARRKHGLVNTIGILKVPDYSDKFLLLPIHPKSSLYQSKEEQNMLDYYSVAGVKIKSVVAGEEYHIEYSGKMAIEDSNKKEVDVRLSAVWRSNLPIFNVANDSSKIATSEAMALEPWSREFFDRLKSHHQTHIEQFGDLEGTVQIDGKEYQLKTTGVRDHTVGARRDWYEFHHYVFHFIRLSNGNAVSIGVISMPVLFRRIVVGFVTEAGTKTNIPIDSCTIKLEELDRKNPPDTYEFDFIAGGKSFHVSVESHSKTTVYLGEQSECCLIEKWCHARVNGVKGWGGVEWQYKTDQNTPKN